MNNKWITDVKAWLRLCTSPLTPFLWWLENYTFNGCGCKYEMKRFDDECYESNRKVSLSLFGLLNVVVCEKLFIRPNS